jgi:hypothetical protein
LEHFLEKLAIEILNEDEGEAVPENIQKLLTKLVYKEPFVARLYSRANTVYISDPSVETAGVRPHQGRIEFSYNPTFLKDLTEPELNFLLQHEVYHIFRSHGKRGAAAGATTNRLHYVMNVAQDALINADCEKDGGFGGHPMEVIKGAWFVEKKANMGSIEETWGAGKEKYKGNPVAEPLFKWMVDRDKQAQQQQGQQGQGKPQKGKGEGQGGGGQAPPWEPSVGDVVFNKKTNEYGKVTGRSGKNVKIDSITEEEATKIVEAEGFKRKTSFIKKDKHDDLWA